MNAQVRTTSLILHVTAPPFEIRKEESRVIAATSFSSTSTQLSFTEGISILPRWVALLTTVPAEPALLLRDAGSTPWVFLGTVDHRYRFCFFFRSGKAGEISIFRVFTSSHHAKGGEPSISSDIMNMAIVMGSMQITNRLDMEDAKTKQTILGVYIAAQVFVIGASYIIRRRIQAKKDTSVLKYIDPPKPFSGEQAKVLTTTNMEYDLEQNTQAQKQALIGLAVMVFLHFQWGMIRPLVVQSILPVKNVLQSKIAKVHLFGKPATGDLRRPWKADSPFAALSGGRDTKPSEATEKAAIKLVEDEERKAAGSGSKLESKKDR
ncbi:hypothetical protein BGZ99_005902 [Dissophora globulifera]|uniref:Uncharacterized protein n=1 Tax=Dissophora globulifera TaxID=979702 RepID=A0A9P6RGD9_9FUNG|nr:hypothetical protein BGZ99_005902 [Dissophora globulifera]